MTAPDPQATIGTSGLILPDILRRHAAERPDTLALVAASAYGQSDELSRVTYAELSARVNRFAAALRRSGINQGDRVVLLFDNTAFVEAIVSLYGGHAAGAVCVPINARFAGPEVVELIERCQASAVVGVASILDRLWPSIAATCQLRTVVVAGSSDVVDAVDWQEFQRDAGDLMHVDISPDDYADWLFTSGTTGQPKCAMSTHQACVATGEIFATAFPTFAGDVLHSTYPFYSSASCHAIALAALWAGATYVAEPTVDIHRVAARIAEERCTLEFIPAAVWTFIFDAGALRDVDVSSVRLLRSGGAPLPTSVIDRVTEAFPNAEMYNCFGMTESGNAGLALNLTTHRTHGASIGIDPMPGMEFRLVDDADNDVAVGEVGEILLRGPCLMAGYHDDPVATAETLRGGWLHTGDLATKDEEGYVHIFDRKKDVIIRGGFNISSVQVENVLLSHPAVVAAAVVAVPHPKLGEDIKAFVVLGDGSDVTPAELVEYCKERLADFKVPREIVVRDELPMTATGKVQKRLLRTQ